jgi:hypothetical protein
MDRDHAQFVACFHEKLAVYNEPELSTRPVIRSRSQLETWLAGKGKRLEHVSVRLVGLTQDCSNAVVTEAIIVGGGEMPEAWRLTIAARTEDDLIREVRAFRDRDAALGWVGSFG